MNTANFTEKLYLELKKAYKQALDEDKVQFVFHDVVLLTSYAKYLIEYLDLIYKQKQ